MSEWRGRGQEASGGNVVVETTATDGETGASLESAAASVSDFCLALMARAARASPV